MKAASDLPRLHSLLASWRGEVVLERYFNGARAARAANVKSVSKSIISALVGIAIDRGWCRARDTIRPTSPSSPWTATPVSRASRSRPPDDAIGLETTSNRNYGAWVQNRNWVQHALAKPLFAMPGTEMEYSTGNTHLLSAILTKATKTQHLAVCAGVSGEAARVYAAALAAGSPGRLLRRQRHAAHAQADAVVW